MYNQIPQVVAALMLAVGLCACGPEYLEESESQPTETAVDAIVGCRFHVDNPHKSSHVPGMVNVVARLECNSPVSAIAMTVQLARDRLPVATQNFANSGNASLRGNAATLCVSGTYQGAAVATVTFPPGSISPRNVAHANSDPIYINCQ